MFYNRKQPGVKTNWIMYEYRLEGGPKRKRDGPEDMKVVNLFCFCFYNLICLFDIVL